MNSADTTRADLNGAGGMRVRVAGVTVTLGVKPIVTGADLDIPTGVTAGLVGPNGCGKSTLLRTIYRALRPDTGAVWVGGDDVRKLSARRAARRTAVVAQETPADFDFTAFEVVAMGRGPHKAAFSQDTDADHALCRDALARVGMLAAARQSFASLSGGEKQRVLIARALAQQSRLLVLDEPTNHLDIRYQHQILELTRGLGVTVLAALHDLNHAAAYCDQVHVMTAGRIVAGGAPDQVLSSELIAEVFGVHADVITHPRTGQPLIAFSPVPDADAVTRGHGGEAGKHPPSENGATPSRSAKPAIGEAAAPDDEPSIRL